jgi:hypothetical protein
LDWEEVLKSPTLDATVHYKLLRNWKNAGYLVDGIVPSDELLCRLDKFIVLDNPEMRWFEDRIRDNHDFRIEPWLQMPKMPYPGPTKGWEVTRITPCPAKVPAR